MKKSSRMIICFLLSICLTGMSGASVLASDASINDIAVSTEAEGMPTEESAPTVEGSADEETTGTETDGTEAEDAGAGTDTTVIEDVPEDVQPTEPETAGETEETGETEEVEEAEETEAPEEELMETLAEISQGYYVLRSALNKSFVLSVKDDNVANKTPIVLGKYASGSTAQIFRLTKNSDATWCLYTATAGKAMDVRGASKTNKAVIQTYRSNLTVAQKFNIVDNGDGTVSFKNSGSGLMIDVANGKATAGNTIWQYKGNQSKAQKFYLEKVSTPSFSDYSGTYVIRSAINRNYVWDIAGGSTATKGNVQIYRSNATQAQVFKVEKVHGNYYRIRNAKSGLVVDVASGKTANRTNIQQYTENGSDAQSFKIVKNSDGTFTFRSMLSDNCAIDVSGATAANKQNVQLYRANNSVAQKFILDANLPTALATTSGTQATVFMNKTDKQRIEIMGPIIAANAKKTNTLASARIAMFAYESAFGTSYLAQQANNCFGMMKGKKKYPGSGWDGSSYITRFGKDYRKYACIEDSVADQGALLSQSDLYKECVKKKDTREFLETVCGTYTGSSGNALKSYIDNLMKIVDRYDLTKYDK